jgi:hypothetical protein
MQQPNATGLSAAPLTGVAVAGIVAMSGSAFGLLILRVLLGASAGDPSSGFAWLLLSGVSVRSFVAHALTAELFITAYPRMPTVRHHLDHPHGWLGVGAVLGTLMWVVIRAAMPTFGPLPLGRPMVSWLTMALFSGPMIVWIARQYVSTSRASDAAREARRRIAGGLAAILPGVCVLVWCFGTEAGSMAMIGVLFAAVPALAAIVAGTSMLLGGTWKALGLDGERWVKALPYVIALAALFAAMAMS